MTHLLHLRDYQADAVTAVESAWKSGMQRPAVVMATGLGKTIVFSHLASRFMDKQSGPLDEFKIHPAAGHRTVILVHRDELADQTLDKLSIIAPDLSLGKVKAEDDQTGADVMVCSVQTLARPERAWRLLDARSFAGDIGLVIVDECHHALASSYRNIMAALGCYDGTTTRAVGFTATLARGDGRGLGDVWQDAVYTRSVLAGIAGGHLVDIRAKRIDVADLDLSTVKRAGGDYTAKSLGEALLGAGGPDVIRETIAKHAADRRSILVFVPTVAMAEATAAVLPSSAIVHGGTPRPDRLRIYEQFRTGAVRVIVNCMVLTEGADFPYADCAVIARPTRSDVLFTQMIGRILRPFPATGKTDALALVLGDGTASIRTLVDLEPDVQDVEDGESLAEAYEREQARAEEKVPAGSLRFELKHRDLDLFRASPAYQWLRTNAGVQFIPLGGAGEIVLWPGEQPGLWDVVWAPEENYRRLKWQRLHTGLDLGMAMAWAESEADDRSLLNTGKAAVWRKRRASEKQLDYAARLGFDVDGDMRAGEVGDMISMGVASRWIDRYARRV